MRARHAEGRIKQDPDVLIHVYHDILNRLVRRELKPKLGLETALAFVAQQRWKCAVASSGDRQYIEVILDVLGLEKCFHAIATGDEVQYGKPHPAVYLLVAQRLQVPPQACVALEDSPRGVQAAKAAGMRCIAIPEEPDAEVSCADAVCVSLVEATKRLQEWALITR
jgi:HAD superfamily hydrolase (TIGR01509 family)